MGQALQTVLRHNRGCSGVLVGTYHYLGWHESDFRIAQQDSLRLIPPEVQWSDFCRFISDCDRIRDCDVSLRYSYGELRLSRLNLYAPLLLRKSHFDQMHGQYSDYFARFYGPILFIFATVSIMLNCMQVGLATEQISSKHWVALWSVSRWFSVSCMIGAALVLAGFGLLWMLKVLDEWIFAVRIQVKRRHNWRDRAKC